MDQASLAALRDAFAEEARLGANLLRGGACALDQASLAALRDAFAEEARLGANLSHPAIATVLDYGFHDDKPFTVFEYLPGETLRELLRRRERVPLEEVRLIVGPLAQALDFAHARRVVHRDLKPDNVRATEQGQFKVLDLGLAREFGRDVDWSGFAGSPPYASPEQASGHPCDGRADQYALALIVFELLTGHRLFQASDKEEWLRMHREAEPAALATDLADAPETVRLALARALSKDPNARFATCGDLAVELGCQFISVPPPAPEVLLEADVERMTVGRLIRWGSFPGFKNAVHLALTHEALWAADRTEVRRWSLSDVERIEPRSDPIDDMEGAEQAEVVRRLHLDAEASIRNLGRQHVLSILVWLALMVCLGRAAGADAWTQPNVVALSVVLTGLSIWLFAVGQGLRRLEPWARRAALTEAMVALVAILLTAVTVTANPSGPYDPGILVLLCPLIVPGVRVVWILLCREASVVFSPMYWAVVDRTPNLDPHRAFLSSTEYRPGPQTLRLMVHNLSVRPSTVAFRFATAGDCKYWAGRLTALAGRSADPATPGREAAPAEASLVVLLRQRPSARFQLLGTVEAKADKRRKAESGLQVRAAMMGADAVVDLQDEFLPDFRRTVRRLTGTAVRAVDVEGRFELRSRWYADRVARISTWAAVLLLISLTWWVFGVILFNPIMHKAIGMMTADAAGTPPAPQTFLLNTVRQTFLSVLILAAIHAWPLGLAALVRGLRWPQIVPSLALTLVAFALHPVYSLTGEAAGALLSEGWSVLIHFSFRLLLSAHLAELVAGIYLGRAAWRADREFRRLVPDAARSAPPHRSLVGGLTLVVSVTYAALLACCFLWVGYLDASDYRLPTEFNRKETTAESVYLSGLSVMVKRPQEAEGLLRKAIPLWEELVREVPQDVDLRMKLAKSYYYLCWTRRAQGLPAEALDEAVAAYREAIRLKPDDAGARSALGSVLAWKGQLDQAVAVHREVIRLKPDDADAWYGLALSHLMFGDADAWYGLALSHLMFGDADGYRRACAEMLRKFGEVGDPRTASRVSYTCVAGPSVGDTPRLIRLATQAVPCFKGNERILGAALFRAGRYEEALEQFTTARKKWNCRAWDWLFLAMIHHHLGHPEESHRCLTESERWIGEAKKARESVPGSDRSRWGHWTEQAEVMALRREANVLTGVHGADIRWQR